MANYDGARIGWDHRERRTAQVTFGQIRYQPGGYCGPRRQRDYQLVVLHAGSCRVDVNGTERELAVGELHLFVPGGRERFGFSDTQPSEHSWCSVAPSFLPAAWRRELSLAPTSLGMTPLAQRLLAACLEFDRVQGEADARVVEQLGLALFAEYLRASRVARATAPADEGLRRALRHLQENPSEADCLRKMERVAGCSRSALIRRFKRQTGQTPARYLWRVRTEMGIAMLRETGLPVYEIAERCGFSNAFHFSRCVKRITGGSPRKIRQQAWSGGRV